MPPLIQNPADALRRTAEDVLSGTMLRWDMSGRALLVSDAPRRPSADLPALIDALRPYHVFVDRALLYLDLSQDDYADLSRATFFCPGAWVDGWFAEQALLASLLRRRDVPGVPDTALLREAMLSCARGGATVRSFCARLRGADASALREGTTSTSSACAAIIAQWLWASAEIGLPETRGIDYRIFFMIIANRQKIGYTKEYRSRKE